MNALALVRELPDGATIPASLARAAVAQAERERVLLAADREDTLEMWAELATRYLCGPTPPPSEAPAWDQISATGDHGRILSGCEA